MRFADVDMSKIPAGREGDKAPVPPGGQDRRGVVNGPPAARFGRGVPQPARSPRQGGRWRHRAQPARSHPGVDAYPPGLLDGRQSAGTPAARSGAA